MYADVRQSCGIQQVMRDPPDSPGFFENKFVREERTRCTEPSSALAKQPAASSNRVGLSFLLAGLLSVFLIFFGLPVEAFVSPCTQKRRVEKGRSGKKVSAVASSQRGRELCVVLAGPLAFRRSSFTARDHDHCSLSIRYLPLRGAWERESLVA